ncbi:MAG: hypothetical protein AAF514_18145, partial [Verrucomicrobiota bacterium]
AHAFGTVFQTFDWLSSWVETVADHELIVPVIVVGRSADGAPEFILPFVPFSVTGRDRGS